MDAAANRAGEGLRTAEDALRFALDRGDLVERTKSLRHRLRTVLEAVNAMHWMVHRDAAGDVGQHVHGSREHDRQGVRGVAIAAMKRSIEALRSLEEFGKLTEGSLARECAALRYAAYDLERDVMLAFGSPHRRQPRLCLLITESLCTLPWRDTLKAAIDGGVDMVQVREKDFTPRALLQRVREVMALAKPRGVGVIVNDSLDVAIAARADGVHLGRDDLPLIEARRIAGPELLLGATAHDLCEAASAIEAGADVLGIGAMFATPLKPGQHASGPGFLKEFIERFPRTPHVAIGGIHSGNMEALTAVGVRGVAVCSAICSSKDPASAAAAMCAAMAGVCQP